MASRFTPFQRSLPIPAAPASIQPAIPPVMNKSDTSFSATRFLMGTGKLAFTQACAGWSMLWGSKCKLFELLTS